MSRLCIITLLYQLICRIYHGKSSLDEAKARIKSARRNNNNLQYADDTILMAESKEDLKSLLLEEEDQGDQTSQS